MRNPVAAPLQAPTSRERAWARAQAQWHTWGGPRLYVDPETFDVFHRETNVHDERTEMCGGGVRHLLPGAARTANVAPKLSFTTSHVAVTHEPDGTPARRAREGLLCRIFRMHAHGVVDAHRQALRDVERDGRAYLADHVSELEVHARVVHLEDHMPQLGLGREWIQAAVLFRFDGLVDDLLPRHLLFLDRHILAPALKRASGGEPLVDAAWTDASNDILVATREAEIELPRTQEESSTDAARQEYYASRTLNSRAVVPFRRTDFYFPTRLQNGQVCE
jgi:hypothetical protein